MRRLLLTLAATTISFAALADDGRGVGYPTVAAALEALKARSDANVSVRGGWTIVNEKPANAIWSFTPPGHPAHPAVVKRTVVSQDGAIALETTALCQASKAACDKLMDEFKQLNAQVSQSISGKVAPAAGAQPSADSPKITAQQWHPARAQVQRVELQSNAYFAAKDGHRYKEAYAMLSPVLQQITPFEPWSAAAENLNSKIGRVLRRDIKKITWYKNPAQAAPGTYAAVDFSSQFTDANIHCGYLVWVEQGDGSFLLVREEVNFVDKATQQKSKPDELKRALAQFGCKG